MRPPDQKEREKIVKHLDATMLVEAAAGTGKTTAMVDRMIALLDAGKCQVHEMAALTFTRKAAAELQERFQAKFAKSGGSDAGLCFIGTIHSFCAQLLRERPVEAGVDPDFEELDEVRDVRLREQAWENFGNELYGADDPLLDELENLGLTLAELRNAFLQFADYPDVEDWPASAVPAPALEPATRALREYAEHIKQVLPAEDGTDELIGLWRRVLRMIRSRDLERHADVAEILEQFKPDRKCTQKNWPGGKEQALREHDDWNRFASEVAIPFCAAWRAHRYPTVLKALERARAVYDREREAARGLNFQDLLMRAAKLLRERTEIRQYFRHRFTHLLVDEFQDTDPVQAEVLLLLTADNPEEKNWRKCRPAAGALFVVGDPKQSIYRFRRADIMTYNIVKEIITATGGLCVHLTANFRSAAPVVEWVNKTCRGFFPAAADEFSPGYAEFLVGRGDAGIEPGLFKIVTPEDLTNQQDIAEHEADLLARHIHGSKRAPGDFLIITRQKKRLSVYAAALQRLGIAHEVTGGSSLNEVRELGLLQTVLRAVLEPDNPVALVAALRSELFGYSDQELYHYRRAGGRFDYRRGGLEAYPVFSRYAEWLASLPPMIAIERIAADLGLLALAAAGGNVAAGSLSKAIELLRAAQSDLPTAADFVIQLGRLVEQAEQYDGAPATAPVGSVVRVMNLHKVKGLQAPVVFLADPSGASEHDVKLYVDRRQERVTGYLALYGEANVYGQALLLAHPSDWEAFAVREQRFQDAENNRLLYVAATRAGDQLIVSLRRKSPKSNPWQPFAEALAAIPELPDPGPQSPPVQEPAKLTSEEVVTARALIATRWKNVLSPTYAERAAKQVVFPGTPRLAAVDNEGMRWGSVIHLLLQAAMQKADADLKALAVSALREADLDVAWADEAVDAVHRVTNSKLWQRAKESRQRLTEVGFVVRLPGEEAVVRGVIDLAFEEADGWVLVDYKTDRGGVDKLAETYRSQLQTYRSCWQQSLGQKVKEMGVYATRANRYLIVPV
jgi:ATP-dependent helicase/nuclease subunit A